jgi:hypothetical protein
MAGMLPVISALCHPPPERPAGPGPPPLAHPPVGPVLQSPSRHPSTELAFYLIGRNLIELVQLAISGTTSLPVSRDSESYSDSSDLYSCLKVVELHCDTHRGPLDACLIRHGVVRLDKRSVNRRPPVDETGGHSYSLALKRRRLCCSSHATSIFGCHRERRFSLTIQCRKPKPHNINASTYRSCTALNQSSSCLTSFNQEERR